jgi:hypothetical protein
MAKYRVFNEAASERRWSGGPRSQRSQPCPDRFQRSKSQRQPPQHLLQAVKCRAPFPHRKSATDSAGSRIHGAPPTLGVLPGLEARTWYAVRAGIGSAVCYPAFGSGRQGDSPVHGAWVRETSTVIDDACWKQVWAEMTDSELEDASTYLVLPELLELDSSRQRTTYCMTIG